MNPSRSRGSEKEGETLSARAREVGGGTGVFLEVNQECIKRRDFEGGRGGGVRFTQGRVMWQELKTSLE